MANETFAPIDKPDVKDIQAARNCKNNYWFVKE